MKPLILQNKTKKMIERNEGDILLDYEEKQEKGRFCFTVALMLLMQILQCINCKSKKGLGGEGGWE